MLNPEFEIYKEQIKMLINMLSNPDEQVVLLLRLGYVNNQYYSEEQIVQFLNTDKTEIHNILNSGLENIAKISTLTTESVKNLKQQLGIKNFQSKTLIEN